MADYFSSDHFELLKKWDGQKRDESNPEQNHAYEELKKAYEVTEAWATTGSRWVSSTRASGNTWKMVGR